MQSALLLSTLFCLCKLEYETVLDWLLHIFLFCGYLRTQPVSSALGVEPIPVAGPTQKGRQPFAHTGN